MPIPKYIRHYIAGIEFGILSPEMIKKMAVMKVTTPDLYDADGYPVEGGLMDPRLGVIDPGLRCRTCGGRLGTCFGHFGYIELAKPVIHPLFAPMIFKILLATCPKCGRVTLPEERKAYYKRKMEETLKLHKDIVIKDIIREILNEAKKVQTCPYCGAKKTKITFIKPYFFFEDREEGKVRLTPQDIRQRLEKIPDEDLIFLGLSPKNRPEWMVLTMLPIPPITARVSIILETGQRSEDDLTHKLGEIVRANIRLQRNIDSGAIEIIVDDLWGWLQYNVATFFSNELPNLPPARRRSKDPLKTLAQRIKGKEGRIRGNLLGKRVNFCARSVITPDNYIQVYEVGVPEEFAKELTIPERVTEWNVEWLRKLVLNGPNKHPGANYVITPDGKRIRITDENKEEIARNLAPGWVVERHIMDGDIALFNRQPSLHRISIMAHKVKVLPGRSLRIHLAATVPYNADFDGDEMNLHIPQTEEARAEAEELLIVTRNIVTPRYGLPLVGLIHGHILGLYILTKYLDKLSKNEAAFLLSSVGIYELPEPAGYDENGEPYWTGKQIFSALLPKDFNYEGETLTGEKVVVRNGQLIEGYIDSKAVAAEKGVMLRKLIEKYGDEFGIDFIWKAAMLGLKTLRIYGATVAISNLEVEEDIIKSAKEKINETLKRVYKYIEDYKTGKLQPFTGMSAEDTLNRLMDRELDRVREEVVNMAMGSLREEGNALVMMIRSGSRGKPLNVAEMTIMLGQQTVRGQRIRWGYRKRTLPHFKKGDISPEATGFIARGFMEGLTPTEFFFHAMAGRDSVIATQMNMPVSGYLYRRIVNAARDLVVQYDGTVRDSWNIIVQFKYGEDGIDVTKSVKGELDISSIIDRVLEYEVGRGKENTS